MFSGQISAAVLNARRLAAAQSRQAAKLVPPRSPDLKVSVQTLLAWSLLMGRSIRSLAAAASRWSLLSAGWLLSSVRHRSLAGLSKQWFTVRRWHLILGALLGCKALQLTWRLAAWLLRAPARRRIQRQMKQAQNYEEWSSLVRQLDRINRYRADAVAASLPDEEGLRQRMEMFRRLRLDDDVAGLMYALRVQLARHVASVKDGAVAEHCPLSALRPLRSFIEEVQLALHHVADAQDVPLHQRLTFFRELRHAFGRTGLCLSGGASFGFFHFGVWQELLTHNLLPRVLTGSSAGSIVAASICTRTDEELCELASEGAMPGTIEEVSRLYGQFLLHDTHWKQWKHMLTQGHLHDVGWFTEKLQALFGDLTFSEAYQLTGRVLNVSVTAADYTTSEPYRLLNYLTAPDVLVRSGVAASCSFPLLFHSQELLVKDPSGNIRSLSPQGTSQVDSLQRRWIDGSIQADLPMAGISEMFNVNFFLVSQCNPHLVPIIAARRALPSKLGRLLELELKHRCSQLLHFFPKSHLFSFLRQTWEGDISMVLPSGVLAFGRATFNLNYTELRTAMQEGRVATWSKLSAIRASCAIEVGIDECLRSLTSASQAQRTQQAQRTLSLRRSLPSWMHIVHSMPPPAEGVDEAEEEGVVRGGDGASGAAAEPAHPECSPAGAPLEPQASGDDFEFWAGCVKQQLGSSERGAEGGAGGEQGLEGGKLLWRDLAMLRGYISTGGYGLDVIAL